MSINPATDALIVVDMQNDFAAPTTGTLYVRGAESLVPLINAVSQQLPFRLQVGTQDWHTADHCSFQAQGGPWPAHCVAGTAGASLCDGLDDRKYDYLLRKGKRQAVDSNSAFRDASGAPTGLHALLADAGVTRVFLVGVALDVCVRATATDAVAYGLDVVVWEDACKAVTETAREDRYGLPEGVVIERAAAYLPRPPPSSSD